jgi:hypothetical protein
MARHGFAGPKADFPRAGPHPERLRKKLTGRNKPGRGTTRRPSRPRTHRRSVLPIPPPSRPPDRGGQASRDDGSHAGPPQGSLTCETSGIAPPRLILYLLLVFWLTSAIHRIVKDLLARRT